MFEQLPIYVAIAAGIIVLAGLLSTFFTVEQRTVAIVQRFGKFMREAGPGLNTKIPILDRVVGRINLRVQQLDVSEGTRACGNCRADRVRARECR